MERFRKKAYILVCLVMSFFLSSTGVLVCLALSESALNLGGDATYEIYDYVTTLVEGVYTGFYSNYNEKYVIPEGVKVYLYGGETIINGALEVYGTLYIVYDEAQEGYSGYLENNGVIIVRSSGGIYCQCPSGDWFDNDFIGNNGKIIVYGAMDLCSFQLKNYGTIEFIGEDAFCDLTICLITNDGIIKISELSELISLESYDGSFVNKGLIENAGICYIDSGFEFINDGAGTITNTGEFFFEDYFENYGTITNTGEFTVESGSIENYGTIYGTIDGTVNNYDDGVQYED